MTLEEEAIRAAQANDAARLRELLDGNPDLLRMRTREGSLVLTAAYRGAAEALGVVLDRSPELDLYEAAAVGDVPRIRRILEAGSSRPDVPNHDGYTPLGLATFFGHTEAVETLLEAGAPVDQVMASEEANTALDAATAANRLEVVKLLLEAGADPNVRSRGGVSPLHKAAFNGRADMARLLLNHGADPRARSDAGKTPEDVARERSHPEVADLLGPP